MNAIASERKRLGLSQEELAEKMGCDRSTIIRWEADTSRVAGGRLCDMADLFGCSIDYLLGRTDDRLPVSR